MHIGWMDGWMDVLLCSPAARLLDSKILRFSGFLDSQIPGIDHDIRILRFLDPLLKRRNLIGRDDPVLDSSKLCLRLMLYGHTIWQSCFNVLCYLVMLYGIYSFTLYGTIWESCFNVL